MLLKPVVSLRSRLTQNNILLIWSFNYDWITENHCVANKVTEKQEKTKTKYTKRSLSRMNDILRMCTRIDHSPMYLYIESVLCACIHLCFNSRVFLLCLCAIFCSFLYLVRLLWFLFVFIIYYFSALLCYGSHWADYFFQVNRYLMVIVLITCSPLYLTVSIYSVVNFFLAFFFVSVIFFLIVIMYLLL